MGKIIGIDSTIILALATAIGSFGIHPTSPKIFKRIGQNILIQYILLFILIWQGGKDQNTKVAFFVTIFMFVIIEGIKYIEKNIYSPASGRKNI